MLTTPLKFSSDNFSASSINLYVCVLTSSAIVNLLCISPILSYIARQLKIFWLRINTTSRATTDDRAKSSTSNLMRLPPVGSNCLTSRRHADNYNTERAVACKLDSRGPGPWFQLFQLSRTPAKSHSDEVRSSYFHHRWNVTRYLVHVTGMIWIPQSSSVVGSECNGRVV